MSFQIIDTGINSAQENMQFDEMLLKTLDPNADPILHFYDWKDKAATHGYFIDPHRHIKPGGQLDLARRPTGGGIVFHIWDFAFSVLIPASHPGYHENTLENYEYVNEKVLQAITTLVPSLALLAQEDPVQHEPCRHFCMAKPTQYDVMLGSIKVAGAAQRRKANGYLHQGTISLAYPDEDFLQEVLLDEGAILAAMKHYSFYILHKGWQSSELLDLRCEIKALLGRIFKLRK